MTPAPLYFTNARLIDPATGYDGPGALKASRGLIDEVVRGTSPTPTDGTVIDCSGLPLAPGIIDMRVFVGEPGARHRESFRSAGEAAAAGGVTTFVAQPETDPPLDDPALVQFALSRARDVSSVRVHAMGALTRGLKGAEITEQQFLLDAGAVALTDGDHAVADAKVLRACMAYAGSLDALIVHHPQEPSLSRGACATSGEFASRLGLPSVPAIAERMMLERDLAMVESTGARYHADMLSTSGALAPLLRARDSGLKVTAGVSIHHLTLNEFDIADYRTFFKMAPPLRAETDREAVVTALAEGLIDVIVSSHLPQDEEAKRLPFEEAATGAVGLETFLPACLRLVHDGRLSLLRLFECAALRPAQILGLPSGRLTAGAPADLILLDPNAPFILDRTTLRSRSKNTPFDRQRMQGRVKGTWVAGRQVFAE
ncbi:MAG TPA: dihydroorotase [Thermohalobaculum sp.]|nr:dihydroorotase [Thermohalobaculum sp.]